MIRKVDQTALRVNQGFIIGSLLVAFVTNSVWLVGLVGLLMVVGTIWPQAALFKWLYKVFLLPAGLLKSDVIDDNPEPHRFAQGFGGVVVALALLTLLLGYAVLGWALTWLVIVLAGLNLFLGFCAGCFVYYQLARLGVPGFDRQPLAS